MRFGSQVLCLFNEFNPGTLQYIISFFNYGPHHRTQGWVFPRGMSVQRSPERFIRGSPSIKHKFWRQRLLPLRIDPAQLSYANNRKVVASGGFGSIRKATFISSVLLHSTGNHHKQHSGSDSKVGMAVAVKSLQAHGDIDSERFEKVRELTHG